MTVDPTADLVLVVDYGAQYAQLIARRVREAKVYSEIVPARHPGRRDPGPQARGGDPLRRPRLGVRAGRAAASTRRSFDAGVPVFGICYGFQAMAQALGGEVAPTGTREYGRTPLSVVGDGGRCSRACPGSRCG